MTKKIVICLGKTGDILALLPLLQQEAKSLNPVALMVAKEYASVMEGQSIVEPIIFDGAAHEIELAYNQAKRMSNDVVCVQVAGPPEQVKKYTYAANGRKGELTDSFAKEPWHILGKMDVWREQPILVFDKRNYDREKNLVGKHMIYSKNLDHKYILVSLGGNNSPFPFRPLLERMLKLQFGLSHEIIHLDEVKAERIYDLLGLYSRASFLVACDSAHLHLATASPNLPVVALINDQPTLWHGSPWRANHIAHVRYSDFARRGIEILDAMETIYQEGKWFANKGNKQGTQFIHIWSHYDLNEGYPTACSTWNKTYKSGNWIAAPIEVGSVGRDSRYSQVKDPSRYPFLKDAIRLGTLRSTNNDILVITKSDTCLKEEIGESIKSPCFCHRFENGAYSPFIDLFAFTKDWWEKHRAEIPELIMGPDIYWQNVLKQLILKHGGTELPLGTVWRGKK